MIEYTIYEDYITWRRIGEVSDKKTKSKQHQASTLTQRTKRIQNKIKKTLLQIRPQPDWFVTMLFPDKGYFRELKSNTAKQMNNLLSDLKRDYRRSFPNGYMFWVAEFAEGRGLHLHCCCHPGEDMSRKNMKRWFRDSWCNIINRYGDDVVHVSTYNRGKSKSFHPSYLTKKSKLKNKMKLVLVFDQYYKYGLIGEKNCTFEKPERFVASPRAEKLLRDCLFLDLHDKFEKKVRSGMLSNGELRAVAKSYNSQKYKIESDYCLHFFNKEKSDEIKNMLRQHNVL